MLVFCVAFFVLVFGCCVLCFLVYFFFFKQKTAYEMRISDWSSDVCSSDLWAVEQATRRSGCSWGSSGGRSNSGDRSLAACQGAQGVTIGRASCRERVCQYV